MARALTRVILASVFVGSLAGRAGAQSFHAAQFGADFSGLGLHSTDIKTGVYGFGARIDIPLTKRLDIDGRLTWFPSHAITEQGQGGRTLQGGIGVRGRFITRGRVSFYGGLWPEFLHFSSAVVGSTETYPTSALIVHGSTQFALDMGLGTEVAIGSGWAVRGELTGPIYAVGGFELFRSQPNAEGAVLSAGLLPRWSSPWQFSAGASYRFDRLPVSNDEQPVAGRCEIGGAVSRSTTSDALGVQLFNLGGFGGSASCRIAPAVYGDAAFDFFPRDISLHTPFSGGRQARALAGAKLGTRKDRYGLFGKVRVGVNSHSQAVSPPALGRYTATAIDIGGVLERYLGRRWFMRFDGGVVISVFHPVDLSVGGMVLHEVAPGASSSIQIAVGAGWRF